MPTPPPTTALTDREEIDETPVGGSVEGKLDEPGETDRFLFQADEGIAYQIKAVWDSLPSIAWTFTTPKFKEEWISSFRQGEGGEPRAVPA